jgi:deoxynogalonate / 12-deoxyaklanonic acid monooxygenase
MSDGPLGNADAVTFVNRFTVHGPPGEFERTFRLSCVFMAEQDGYLGNTLLRHLDDEHQYVNIARWRDVRDFRQAVTHPSFDTHRDALRALAVGEPGLYRPQWSFEPSANGSHGTGR